MKSFLLAFVVLFSLSAFAQSKADTFDGEKCQNGYAGRWDNACKCPNFLNYDGQYCEKKEMKTCRTNQDCVEGSYCYIVKDKGVCHTVSVYNPLIYQNSKFFLGKEILNLTSAENLCKALGSRPLTRVDFNCQGMGLGCLDVDAIIALQERFGNLGFYWLEEGQDNKAYYFDLNDGTVYSLDKDSIGHIQAICILENK